MKASMWQVGSWIQLTTVALLLPISTTPLQAATTWHADVETCPATGDGSAGTPFCAIQDAIDAAADQDEVLVHPGTYVGPINLLGKRVHLRSSDGPELTTLRNETGSVVTCTSGETEETILEGFTIRDGPGTLATNCTGNGMQEGIFGGGVYIVRGGLTVRDCRFENNGNGTGGSLTGGSAIYGHGATMTVSDSVFRNNGTDGSGTGYGVVTLCGEGRLEVRDSTFESNGRDALAGGGVLAYRGSLLVERSVFIDGEASFGAGVFAFPNGLVVPGATAQVHDCDFIGNQGSQGVGMFMLALEGAQGEVTDCRFENNTASGGGGGLVLSATTGASVHVTRSRFVGNIASWGGGLSLGASIDATSSASDLTLVDNHAVLQTPDGVGGGIATTSSQGGSVTVSNVTALENTAWFTSGGINMKVTDDGATEVRNVILRANLPNQIGGPGVVAASNIEGGFDGPGIIDADPLFRDAVGRDYRLLPGSPSIGTGLNPVPFVGRVDLDRQPRVVDGGAAPPQTLPVVDQGAFEYPHGRLLRFEQGSGALHWSEIGGAAQYNVYRGVFGPWTDDDEDGIPDDGYGDCISEADPNSTDTTFTDDDLPLPGSGFFYLISMVDDGGVEYYLGSNSAGVPRQVALSCP